MLLLAKHLVGERHSHTLSALNAVRSCNRCLATNPICSSCGWQCTRSAAATLGRPRAVSDGLRTCLSDSDVRGTIFTGKF